ncbi:MAG: DUF998 domain-containing protein [Candidatus Lokiarchaeota archaeon]|nr:DUF998 domain-containing protein [Candidatus Lokiarchaeota archaeon]
MERETKNRFMDKFLDKLSGGFFGLISVIIGLTGDFLAYLHIPGYNMFDDMVSELGVGPGGVFFNLGLIISGITAIPFYVALGRVFKEGNFNENVRKGAVGVALVSTITFSFIGVFPSDETNYPVFLAHGTFALISWLSGMGYMILFGYLMFKDERFSRYHASINFMIAGIFVIFLLTWLPLWEWILTFAITLWIILNSCFILHHH